MDNRLKQVPLLVFANKQDLPNALTASEVAEAAQLVRLEERTWQIVGCSAVDGTGIKVSAKQKIYIKAKCKIWFFFVFVFIYFFFALLLRYAGRHGLGVQEYEEMKKFMQFLSSKCYQIAFKLQQQ